MKKQFQKLMTQQPLRHGYYYLCDKRKRKWDSATLYVNYYGVLSDWGPSMSYHGFKRKLIAEYNQQQLDRS